jgi:hypothetical protein
LPDPFTAFLQLLSQNLANLKKNSASSRQVPKNACFSSTNIFGIILKSNIFQKTLDEIVLDSHIC